MNPGIEVATGLSFTRKTGYRFEASVFREVKSRFLGWCVSTRLDNRITFFKLSPPRLLLTGHGAISSSLHSPTVSYLCLTRLVFGDV
ncbi:MAG: hypothetical protein WBF90_23150 [Rivularia sp. (in: cyanobacteria)]